MGILSMSRSIVYIPSGTMCSMCVYAYGNCNHLDFSKMRVISSDCSDPGVEYLSVRCASYIKGKSKSSLSSDKHTEVR